MPSTSGAVGWPGVPDHVSLWGLLIPIRRGFQQYVNLRPVRLFEGLKSPLADRKPGDIDYFIVRENNEGEYSSIGGRMYEGTELEAAIQPAVFTKKGCERVMRYAFDLAMTRKRKEVASATKSNGISISMPYWDERFAAVAKEYPQVKTSQFHIDILAAHLVRNPHLVRRDRRLQPVRRHPLRSRPRHHRHDRHRAGRQHQPREGVPLHVRAGARQRARHRRQGHRQPDRPDLVRRHDAGAPGPQGSRRGHRQAIERLFAETDVRTADMGGKATCRELGEALTPAGEPGLGVSSQ